MCAPSQGAMLPYGLKVPSPYFPFGPNGGLTQAHLSALDFQRSQLNDYNVRVQFGLRNYQNAIGLSPFHAYISDPYSQAYFYKHDHRARFVQEEPKPSHSYIGLIGMAILNSKEKKLVLSDIYQWILDNYPYFRTRGPGWRNSIRHNLSLNDCFIKAGRSANGKGHYWAVHPANVDDFERGDFRRRRAQRKVRRHMGLSVPDDEDSPTPSPTQPWHHHDIVQESDRNNLDPIASPDEQTLRSNFIRSDSENPVFCHPTPTYGLAHVQHKKQSRKRLFDMASLLAPDDDDDDIKHDELIVQNERLNKQNVQVSGFDFRSIHELALQEEKVTPVIENTESYTYEDFNVDMNSSSSCSGRDLNDDSEDDGENDEIQVTSGDDSPTHEQGSNFDAGHVQSTSYINEKASKNETNIKRTVYSEKDDTEPLKWFSSPYKSETKTHSALDLSPSTISEDETKMKKFYSKNNECDKIVRDNSPDNECDIRQHLVRKVGQGLIKMENDLINCNGYDEFKSLRSSCVSMSRSGRKNSDHDRPHDSGEIGNTSLHHDHCLHRRELAYLNSSDSNHTKRSVHKLNCYLTEQHDPCRQKFQIQGDSNSESKDDVLVPTDQHIHAEKRGRTSQECESVKISGDMVGWSEMAKSSLVRDRQSAFSPLGIKNHSIYSPIQQRHCSVLNQRHLPKTTAMRTGMQSSLTSVSAPSSSTSTSLTKRSGNDVNMCNNYQISNNTSAHTNGSSK